MTLSLESIDQARERLRGIIKPTPLMPSATLSRMLDADVLLKLENLQRTGSFKLRGAYNRVATITPDEAAHGVIAASAGNHGQALAYAATRAGVKATIVMPRTAAIAKIDATRSYGQQVILEGANYQEARAAAWALGQRNGALFVDAYDDPFVIEGQGTIGLEIADETNADVMLVPVGGGGLLAGIALALAERSPNTEVIGVEASGSPQLSVSLAADAPSAISSPVDTIADGLATGRIGRLPYEIIRAHVHRSIAVNDFEIGEAVLLMLERMKLVAEGAGAAALAGALKLKPELRGKRVVVCISGGNIDINLLDRIISHGLAQAGRLVRLGISLHDRPGELQKLLALVSESGANVHSIGHDRSRRDVPITGALVEMELETRGPDHVNEVLRRLEQNGYVVETPPSPTRR
ncbi:MAG TPA: threonine ammonia-lyase [Candidatus Binataceae bacterium]|nr:threonine ammonia-lyase [Candidatus Binataceae bacterium]